MITYLLIMWELGSIECRFTGTNLEHLGRYFLGGGNRNLPHFTIRERHQRQEAQKHRITPEIASKMIQQQQFSMSPVEVALSEKVAIIEILMHFDDKSFPISGFPRSLQDNTKGLGPPSVLAVFFGSEVPNIDELVLRPQYGNSTRQPFASQVVDGGEWTGPVAPRASDTLAAYGNPDYAIGKTPMSFGANELDGEQVFEYQAELSSEPPEPKLGRRVDREIPLTSSPDQGQSEFAPLGRYLHDMGALASRSRQPPDPHRSGYGSIASATLFPSRGSAEPARSQFYNMPNTPNILLGQPAGRPTGGFEDQPYPAPDPEIKTRRVSARSGQDRDRRSSVGRAKDRRSSVDRTKDRRSSVDRTKGRRSSVDRTKDRRSSRDRSTKKRAPRERSRPPGEPSYKSYGY
jgi:hypothetical protein